MARPMTVEEIRRDAGRASADGPPETLTSSLPAVRKAALVETWLANDHDGEIFAAIDAVFNRPDPVDPVLRHLARARSELKEGLRAAMAQDYGDEFKQGLTERLDEISAIISQFRDYLSGMSLNDALADILGGE